MEKNKPIHKIRFGAVVASIWENESEQGTSFRSVTLERIYKKDGRVLDPDPKARGRQGNTQLSQLQAVFLIVLSVVLYGVFLGIQTVTHSDIFQHSAFAFHWLPLTSSPPM